MFWVIIPLYREAPSFKFCNIWLNLSKNYKAMCPANAFFYTYTMKYWECSATLAKNVGTAFFFHGAFRFKLLEHCWAHLWESFLSHRSIKIKTVNNDHPKLTLTVTENPVIYESSQVDFIVVSVICTHTWWNETVWAHENYELILKGSHDQFLKYVRFLSIVLANLSKIGRDLTFTIMVCRSVEDVCCNLATKSVSEKYSGSFENEVASTASAKNTWRTQARIWTPQSSSCYFYEHTHCL